MRTKKGVVVSKSGNKTIIVEVETSKKHPKYQKRYLIHRKYHVHDEENTCKEGETVTIYETRPLSALKRWTVTPLVAK
jgi:small subunit ribosomal protein S17